MLTVDVKLPRQHFTLKVNHQFDADSRWAIMGASGCGKTSLLRVLAGLEDQTAGVVRFNEEVWQDSARCVFMPPQQRRIGYIFQESRLFPHLTVRGNLQFAIQRAHGVIEGLTLQNISEQMGIIHLLERSVTTLSGGEKQRVAIARTLLNAPQLLLMDEPLASLDVDSRRFLLQALSRVHQQYRIPCIMVSHAPEDVARFADNVLQMKAGEVIGRGRVAELLHQTDLNVLYATVLEHEPLGSWLLLEGQRVLAPPLDTADNSVVRIILPASSIIVMTQPQTGISLQNQLPVVVKKVEVVNGFQANVLLRSDEQTLTAHLTRSAVVQLGLQQGMPLWAGFKASCLQLA